MFVLGTAGHVDHGKSTLVHALTGIDPDRLREEKERGMTIDLGFAWLTLPSGREVSVVDVPGHERFIKNMLAGVGGIDLALLIIAADEGVMPQTREHLAILDLLRVTNGVAVITKADLVEPDWLELVTADVKETLSGTSLASAPVLAVSALTGAGLDNLMATIDDLLDRQAPRADRGRPRLPVDRIFTVAGFGTVVTGTLIDGVLTLGEEVEILPRGQRSRVRGLQVHRTKHERAGPGSRVAINLAGLATTEVRRGDVVVRPGWLQPTSAIDVRLRALATLERPLRHNCEVTLHLFSTEVAGKVRLLEAEALVPGESGWAQIRTASPIAAVKGDLFVIRSANETLGGGEVLETGVKRHRRRDPRALLRLAALERGSEPDLLVQTLRAREPAEVEALLKRVPLPPSEASIALQSALEAGEVRVLGGRSLVANAQVMTAAGWGSLTERVREALSTYHRQYPLRPGMPREEMRSRLGTPAKAWSDVLDELIASGTVAEAGAALRLPEFAPALSPAQRAEVERYLAALRAEPYAPSAPPPADPELLAYLVESGQVVRVAGGVVFAAEAYRAMVDEVVRLLRERGTITVAEVRNRFATSRKYALGLLEHLDERRVTRRHGDERVLREPPVR